MNKKLLYFNLAVDEKDTSLGFAIDWIKHVSNEFNHVDVVSLRVNSIPEFDNSINIYGLEPSNNKISKYLFFLKTVKQLINENNYDRCFSHMSPISVVLSYLYLKKSGIKTTLWFTHPGPKFGIKKLILYLSFLISEQVVTASNTSFPFKGKKVNVIGHAINFEKFNKSKTHYSFEKFLMLSRISKSKNLEVGIDSFLNSRFKNFSLDIIGGPLNKNDEKYLKFLQKKYKSKNVNFLGKIDHEELENLYKEYCLYVSSSNYEGNPKTVLEALSFGCVTILSNIPNHKELVDHSKTGFIFDKKEGSLRQMFESILNNEYDLSSISKEGFSYVQNNNSLQRSVDVEMKDYNYLLQKSR